MLNEKKFTTNSRFEENDENFCKKFIIKVSSLFWVHMRKTHFQFARFRLNYGISFFEQKM